jgi:hypothetical protein
MAILKIDPDSQDAADHIISLGCDPQVTSIGIPVTQEKLLLHRNNSYFTGKWSCITKDF